jgi:hypothetical protein
MVREPEGQADWGAFSFGYFSLPKEFTWAKKSNSPARRNQMLIVTIKLMFAAEAAATKQQ